jgi:3-methylfumaryl-CoA hydratase
MDLDSLRAWIGRSETRSVVASAMPLAQLAATLARGGLADPAPGTLVPPLWHWLYFLPLTPASELGPDGHARRGGFLPPVALPRRMWAGGRLAFHQPIAAGDEIERGSRIAEVSGKAGKSGPLVFVTVRHAIRGPQGLAIEEEHDIVYREAPRAGSRSAPVTRAPNDETFAREIAPDPVLLFRYSALTFNGHRIHYDRSYVTQVEGYPGLVVHGPLIATLLLELLHRERPEAALRRFAFKALRPVFDIHRFTLCGRPEPGDERRIALWARDHEGALALEASAEIE